MQFLGEKFLFYHHIKWVEATSCAHRAPLPIDKITITCSKIYFQLCTMYELCSERGGIQKEQLQSNEEPKKKEPKKDKLKSRSLNREAKP